MTLFLMSLKKKTHYSLEGTSSVIDLNMSNAMKGIACVMILTAHWGQRRFNLDMPWGVSKLVWKLSADIALVWFMFFSGYGLSIKNIKDDEILIPIWLKRLKKVYFPLLYCCIICTIGYSLLPSIYSVEESLSLWLSPDIYYLHHLTWKNFCQLWPHILGWKDWYVLCIIIFYSLFYLSLHLERKTAFSQTTWLFLLLGIYYVWAFCYWGRSEGHFFRYCWIFFISHVVAKWETYYDKRIPLLMSISLSITLLLESKIMLLAFFIAVVAIITVSILNKYYIINGKMILLLGSISYFFYLLHARICYALIVYLNINSIIAWVLLTMLLAWIVYRISLLPTQNIKMSIKNSK